MQDREVLQVILTVTAPPPGPGQPPGPTNAPSPSTSAAPSTTQPTSTTSGTPSQQAAADPTLAVASTKKEEDPCAIQREDCEKLRLLAEQKEAAAAAAKSEADKTKADYDQAENAAKVADYAAAKAARAAQPTSDGGKISVDGETFDQADSEWLDAKREALFGEWQAGRISSEEQQRQRAALSGPDALRKAREERLAKAAELKQAAEQAKAAADKARAAADATKADAGAAQERSDIARSEAESARKKYDECLKKVEDECRRVAEAKAAAEAKARKEEEERRRNAASDHEYLIALFVDPPTRLGCRWAVTELLRFLRNRERVAGRF